MGYVLCILFFGIIIRNCEKYVSHLDTSPVTFEFFPNTFWCMVLVMTTVGYGEIFPVTHHGRIFTVLACLVGTFINSILIVSLTNLISMSPEEEVIYEEMVKMLQNKNRLSKDALEYIRVSIIYRMAKKFEYRKKQPNLKRLEGLWKTK